MKIFAIINNYFVDESSKPNSGAQIDWYELPDSAILRSGNPFFVPDFADEFTFHPSIVYRIGRLGKGIPARFSHRYFDTIGVAGTVVADKMLADLRREGKPWTRATSFDRSCLLGNLLPIDTFNDNREVVVSCGENSICYDIDKLCHNAGEILELISVHNTMKNGDLILVGVTDKGLPLTPENRLIATAKNSENILLDINIK